MKQIASHEDLISRLSNRSTERAAITSLEILQRTVWISVYTFVYTNLFISYCTISMIIHDNVELRSKNLKWSDLREPTTGNDCHVQANHDNTIMLQHS